jgi:hypothetical protein
MTFAAKTSAGEAARGSAVAPQGPWAAAHFTTIAIAWLQSDGPVFVTAR